MSHSQYQNPCVCVCAGGLVFKEKRKHRNICVVCVYRRSEMAKEKVQKSNCPCHIWCLVKFC